MSQENVELVRALQPAPDVDLVALFGDEGALEGAIEALGSVLGTEGTAGEDFRSRVNSFGEGVWRHGLDGLRRYWQDWLEPWQSYRTEIVELLDRGDRVLVIVNDYGHRRGTEGEVRLFGAAIWTVRDGRAVEAEFYAERRLAYEAVGLEMPTTHA